MGRDEQVPTTMSGASSARTQKICVVMPAYNAEKTLAQTVGDLPAGWFDDVVVVDDASRDRTVEVARSLGLHVLVHPRNRGYGGNQKTCYREALARGAEIVVMVHPDHQYDPKAIPALAGPLLRGECDAVFGSRMLGGRPLEGGMPPWKYLANIWLTAIANVTFYVFLSEYHSGLRAYTRRFLETVDVERNSDDFVFDTQIIAQGVWKGMRIQEIPINTRYFPEASQIGFWRSVRYGFGVLGVLARYKLHLKRLWASPLFFGPKEEPAPRQLHASPNSR
jgi:glycosyltransferase involved in cell wall biosynthesis